MGWRASMFLLSLSLSSSVWSWALEPPSASPISPPAAPAESSPGPGGTPTPPSPPGASLSRISRGLYETADELESLFAALSTLLIEAGEFRSGLEYTLEESMRSVESTTAILRDLRLALGQAEAQRLSLRRELWLWRGATAAGLLAAAAALGWGLSR